MKLDFIDNGNEFDFGRTSEDYAKFRDIYPKNMYDKLIAFGIGKKGQKILDLGSGTAVLPVNMYHTGAEFTATDISENQIEFGRKIAKERKLDNINFKVCSAENTGFEDNTFDVVTAVQCFQYFNADKATKEIRRVLKPDGLFCKIFMDWLPFEDEVIGEMENLVLKYSPDWSGAGETIHPINIPKCYEEKFDLIYHNEYPLKVYFTRESWNGRMKACRGVGASLSKE